MKIKNEKKALQAFCQNDDELSPILNRPFFCEPTGEVRATDGRLLLMVDPKLLRRKYKSSDFGAWLPIPAPNSDTIVTLDDIEAVFNQFELTPEMTYEEGEDGECPECDGTGCVQWKYFAQNGRTYCLEEDCPVCNGTGESDCNMVPTGKMLPPDNAMFVIDGVRFLASCIMKAVEGLRLLGCKELHHISTSKDSPNLFAVQDGIRLLVMPCPHGDGVTKVVRTIKKVEL